MSSKEAEKKGLALKQIDISPNTCYSARYSKLIYDVGPQTWRFVSKLICRVKVRVFYNNSLMEFVASAAYAFSSVKPFDLVFSRTLLSDASYLVNSTITNRLSTCLTLTSVRLQTPSDAFQETFNSLTKCVLASAITRRPQSLQPGCQFSHISIVEGPLAKDTPLGSLAIHFTAQGHSTVGLNSTTIVVAVITNEVVNE